MSKINTWTLDKNYYKDEEEFYHDIGVIVKMLTKSGYTVSFRCEDCGIYVIEYDYTNTELADFIPWVDAEEYDRAMTLLYGCKEDTF